MILCVEMIWFLFVIVRRISVLIVVMVLMGILRFFS